MNCCEDCGEEIKSGLGCLNAHCPSLRSTGLPIRPIVHEEIVAELRAKLIAAMKIIEVLHDHNDPNIKYGNCDACLALDDFEEKFGIREGQQGE